MNHTEPLRAPQTAAYSHTGLTDDRGCRSSTRSTRSKRDTARALRHRQRREGRRATLSDE